MCTRAHACMNVLHAHVHTCGLCVYRWVYNTLEVRGQHGVSASFNPHLAYWDKSLSHWAWNSLRPSCDGRQCTLGTWLSQAFQTKAADACCHTQLICGRLESKIKFGYLCTLCIEPPPWPTINIFKYGKQENIFFLLHSCILWDWSRHFRQEIFLKIFFSRTAPVFDSTWPRLFWGLWHFLPASVPKRLLASAGAQMKIVLLY